MLNPARTLLVATLCLLGLPAQAQAKLTGKVTHQIPGSVGHLPETRNLAGATILVGKDLDVEVGNTGTDSVTGKVLAKDQSEGNGAYSVSLPAGTYTVIFWKQGYVPQVERGVRVPGAQDASLGKDTAGRGLHQRLHP